MRSRPNIEILFQLVLGLLIFSLPFSCQFIDNSQPTELVIQYSNNDILPESNISLISERIDLEIIKYEYNKIVTDTTHTAFISIWDSRLTSSGSSNKTQIRLPLLPTGSYNFTVDWGDGNSDTITSYNQTEVTHDYEIEGIYNITITGEITGFSFYNGRDKLKILEISSWGNLNLGNNGGYFYGCSNLDLTTTQPLNLTGTHNLDSAFAYSGIDDSGALNSWNTEEVVDMSVMFRAATEFNQPLDNWNVSSVNWMQYMFADASSFNQPINAWETNSSRNMFSMFSRAISFNQPLNSWNTGNVQDMGVMFDGAVKFNQPLDNWDVSSVVSMAAMFRDAISFNQNIENWDTSSVTQMNEMFNGAISFDQPLGGWDVSEVTSFGTFEPFLTSLSTENYDQILLGWSSLRLEQGVIISFGDTQYSYHVKEARQKIIDEFSWVIDDGGIVLTSTANNTPGTSGTQPESPIDVPEAVIPAITGNILVITLACIIFIRKRKTSEY